MAILFNPTGTLNVTTDPADLPEEANGMSIISGAMTRCKNLRLNEPGKAITRDGSFTLNETAIVPATWIEVQSGDRYEFSPKKVYKNEVSIASTSGDGDWSAIQYNSFNDTQANIFALNGVDRKRVEGGVVYEWGLEAPTVAPTIGGGFVGDLTGTYNAKYTYVRKVGSAVVAESNPSPAATAYILAGQSLGISVTAPTDSQVTHIRVYRSVSGGAYNYDQEISVDALNYAYGYLYSWEEEDAYLSGDGYGFATSDGTYSFTYSWESDPYTDPDPNQSDTAAAETYTYSNTLWHVDSGDSDGSLGDELETDHDRPPLGSFVIGPAYDGSCFILKDNLLYYCKSKRPEYWPALYYIEVGNLQMPLVTGVFHNGQLYVMSGIEIFYIQGTGEGNFFPLPMKAKTGAQSKMGAVSVTGKGIYHTGPDGIYFYASGIDTKITEDAFDRLFRGEDVNGMPGVSTMGTSWLNVYRNNLYFGYASSDADHPDNILVMNLDTGRTNHFAYNDGSPVEILAMAEDVQNKRLIVSDDSGYVRVIEAKDYADDSGEPIAWDIQSKDYMLSTRRHFPRWVKWDVDASSATSATGEYVLGGSVLTSHALTANRDTKRRLLDTGNGTSAALRIHGSGVVKIYAAEAE